MGPEERRKTELLPSKPSPLDYQDDVSPQQQLGKQIGQKGVTVGLGGLAGQRRHRLLPISLSPFTTPWNLFSPRFDLHRHIQFEEMSP